MVFHVEINCIFYWEDQKRDYGRSLHKTDRNVYTPLSASLLASKCIENLQGLIAVLNHVTGKVETCDILILSFYKDSPSLQIKNQPIKTLNI